ncbi:SMC family, carboxy-terminal domain protein (macronuclear) [Tetrahymena thermophila SB210]|uniref:SMC family, carboxy-terminal domain protein n=1 Tax=Tetrahymena thermophila (strain SB210) TaxID=312017 RepID=W7XEK1_TETTS|nr:SMC family, carboxy-terminal domain protein [Tetrahymena thermophila SB210]EWS75123.1 SMC family, carboxy-terminal domain protein [Tetrahymena thermophila SB210]|eukprot:XP_012652361.1 SMC family, carboxy-terminal domain protein [Tetrahymena thermophila SB210]
MIVLSAIKSIDIFGRPICLNYKSRDYFRSYFGGFTTLALIAFLIYYSRNGLENVLQRQSVNYNLVTSKSDNPDLIQLSSNQFMFAIRIQQTNFLKNPFLNLTVLQTNQTIDSQGNSTRTHSIIRMVPCTLEHWQNFLDPEDGDFQTILNRYSINDALCPSIEDSKLIYVQGTYFNVNFNYLRIAFTTCTSNITNCKTDAQLQAQINSAGQIRAQIFFPSVTINPSQEKYYKKSIDDSYQYTFIPNTNVVTSDIFVQKSFIQTDESLISSSSESSKRLDIFTNIENRFNLQYQQGKKNGDQAVFYLRRSLITYNYDRSFKSLQSFLSELGGIAQVFISALSIFFFMFYGTLFKVQLINELYDIDLKSKQYIKSDKQLVSNNETDGQNKIPLSSQKKNNINNQEIRSSFKKQHTNIFNFEDENQIAQTTEKRHQNDANQNQSPDIIIQQHKNSIKYNNQIQSDQETIEHQLFSSRKTLESTEKTNLLWVKFNNMLNQYQKVKLSFKLFLHLLTCKKYFKDNLFPLFSKSLVHINEDLDISTILYKLQEIEKLKTILLDENQRNLFSFFPKPLIKLNEPLQRKQSYHGSPKQVLSLWKSKIQEDLKQSQKINETPANKLRKRSTIVKKEEINQQHLFTAPKHFTELESFRLLYQAYLQIILCQEPASQNLKINERLIASLGQDLLDIFKIQNEENQSKFQSILKSPSKSPNFRQMQRKLFRNFSSKITDSISIPDDEYDINEQKEIKIVDTNYNNENKYSEQFNATNQNNFITNFYSDQNNKTEAIFSNQDTQQNLNQNNEHKGKSKQIFQLKDIYAFKNKSNSKNTEQEQ